MGGRVHGFWWRDTAPEVVIVGEGLPGSPQIITSGAASLHQSPDTLPPTPSATVFFWLSVAVGVGVMDPSGRGRIMRSALVNPKRKV